MNEHETYCFYQKTSSHSMVVTDDSLTRRPKKFLLCLLVEVMLFLLCLLGSNRTLLTLTVYLQNVERK